MIWCMQCKLEIKDIKNFETSVFTGEYLTDVGDKYFEDLEKKRHLHNYL